MATTHEFTEQAGQSGLPENERSLDWAKVDTENSSTTIDDLDDIINQVKRDGNDFRKMLNRTIQKYNDLIAIRNEAVADAGFSIGDLPTANTVSVADLFS